jgi:colicin import membrane protein
MGKDSLIKSTSKKKSAAGKAATQKEKKRTEKTAIKSKPVKKSTKPKASAKTKKTAPAKAPKKTADAAKKKSTIKAKVTTRKRSPQPKAPITKKDSPQKLILKKFDTWKPEKIFRVTPQAADPQAYNAPPFVSGANDKEIRRVKKLLFKKFEFPPEADTPEVQTDTSPPEILPEIKRIDPAAKLMISLIAGFAVLVILILGASSSNRSNYYIKSTDGAIEVWQGRFAPMGIERIILLPGSQLPERVKDVYSENEIFSIVFNFYLEKSDMLLEVPGMPDFEGIKLYLGMAQAYAITDKLKATVASRLNSIDLMTYLYKADVAASRGTLLSLESALGFLEKAAALELDKSQAELVKKKIQSVKDLVTGLKQKPTKGPQTPVKIPSNHVKEK